MIYVNGKTGIIVPNSSTGGLPMQYYAISPTEIRSIFPEANAIAYVRNGSPLCSITLSSAIGGIVSAASNACYFQGSNSKGNTVREFAPTLASYTKVLMGGDKSSALNNGITMTAGTSGDCGTATSAAKYPAYFSIDAYNLCQLANTLSVDYIVQIDRTELTSLQLDSLLLQMRYMYTTNPSAAFGFNSHFSSVHSLPAKGFSINSKNIILRQQLFYSFLDKSKYTSDIKLLLSVPWVQWYGETDNTQDFKGRKLQITGVRIGFSLGLK